MSVLSLYFDLPSFLKWTYFHTNIKIPHEVKQNNTIQFCLYLFLLLLFSSFIWFDFLNAGLVDRMLSNFTIFFLLRIEIDFRIDETRSVFIHRFKCSDWMILIWSQFPFRFFFIFSISHLAFTLTVYLFRYIYLIISVHFLYC